jgi:hypothetical protein
VSLQWPLILYSCYKMQSIPPSVGPYYSSLPTPDSLLECALILIHQNPNATRMKHHRPPPPISACSLLVFASTHVFLKHTSCADAYRSERRVNYFDLFNDILECTILVFACYNHITESLMSSMYAAVGHGLDNPIVAMRIYGSRLGYCADTLIMLP